MKNSKQFYCGQSVRGTESIFRAIDRNGRESVIRKRKVSPEPREADEDSRGTYGDARFSEEMIFEALLKPERLPMGSFDD